MQYPLYLMNDEILDEAKALGAQYIGYRKIQSRTHLDNVPFVHSFHFFKADKETEVAMFHPDMHCVSWGKLSGFTEIHRKNLVDSEHFIEI